MPGTRKYAEGTEVPIEKSRGEIERMLKKHGATGFGYLDQGGRAAVAFEIGERRYRLYLDYPPLEQFEMAKRANQYSGIFRTREQQLAAQEKELKRLWRSLSLLVKAKLEAVVSGIRTIEQELQGDTVMPNGQTVNEWLRPQLEEAYRTRAMPPLLPDIRRGETRPTRVIESGK